MILNVNDIRVPKRLRAVDQHKVKQIAKSIDETGLINPIIVTRGRLIAGAHRLEAHKLLGRTQIQIRPLSDINDHDKISLIEIDENLFRNELSQLEKMEHISLRVDIISRRFLDRKINEFLVCEGKSPSDDEIKKLKKKSILEAKKEIMEIMNLHNLDYINKSINDHKISVDSNLINNPNIELLTNTQLKDVLKIAKEDAEQANGLTNKIALIKDERERKKTSIKNEHGNFKNPSEDIFLLLKKAIAINNKIIISTQIKCNENSSLDFNELRDSIENINLTLKSYVNKN